MQAVIAGLSSGSHVLGQSPPCTLGLFSSKIPDLHEILISVEKPFSVKNSAEMRRISVGKFFPTEIGKGIPRLLTTHSVSRRLIDLINGTHIT